MLVASTREIIEKLQAYERLYGIGAVTGIAVYCSGNRIVSYCFEIRDDSIEKIGLDQQAHMREIKISAINDEELFKDK